MVRRHVSRRASLTQPLTSLIGREREIHDLMARTLNDDIRLVTLTGPGGIGKTRLALAVAERLRDSFNDDVWIVPLASITGHFLVIPTIAHWLGIEEQADQPILQHLISQLRERRALLILDNVEHVVAAGPEIAHLLGECLAVQILATGREPLHLRGEQLYPVQPLELPAIDNPAAIKTSSESDAVQMFVSRANEVDPDFCLTEQNAPAIVEICHRLDGLPLALELAAARINLLTPDDLLVRLDQPLSVLTGGPRDAPARQQTMRATLQWSYDLLTGEEQRLLRKLAVFSDGCTLEAIEAVSEPQPVLEPLSSLVDKSLIQRVDRPGQATRYGLLEPVRQFALELLTEDKDESANARQRHANYFLTLVGNLRPLVDGPESLSWLERLETEHNNLRSALGWLVVTDQIEAALQLVGDLGIFWVQRHVIEGQDHAERLLTLPAASRRTIGRSKALCTLGWLYMIQAKHELVVPLMDEAREIAEDLGDELDAANALYIRGVCHIHMGQKEQAKADLNCARAEFRKRGIDGMVVRSHFHLGWLARINDDLEWAWDLHEEGLKIARAVGLGKTTMATALALGGLGETVERLGDDERAADLYRERLAMDIQIDSLRNIAEDFTLIARLLRRYQQLEHAVCLLAIGSMLLKQSGTRFSRAEGIEPDEELQALRADMTEKAFQAALERGRSMPLEEAIAIAMQPIEHDCDTDADFPSGLTSREVEVLQQVTQGLTNAQIAEQLFISPRTVGQHLRNIYNKLGVSNRAEATRWAVENGFT